MGKTTIQVIDLGISNLASLINALKRIGVNWEVINSAQKLGCNADAIILPGVGSFSAGMDALRSQGVHKTLCNLVEEEELPILGLCLGMQLLFEGSDEHGNFEGLGLIPGWVKSLPPATKEFKVPNIGWCDVAWSDRDSVLANPEKGQDTFYFVHSYWCDCTREEDVVGNIDFRLPTAAVVEAGSIMGTQFHPEKSLNAGLDLLSRFIKFADDRSAKDT